MDQSKWSIPRLRGGVLTKSMQKLDRPRLKLQGCWAHNMVLMLNVIEVRQASDATMVLEAVAKCLERVHQMCVDKGKPPPKKIYIWVSCLQAIVFC